MSAPTSHSAKDDPRRKDIGFDFWFGSVFPACVINKTNQDHELWFSQEQMRAAWIAGVEAQSGPNSADVAPLLLTLDNAVAGRITLDRFQLATIRELIAKLAQPEAGPGSEK